jgi:Protein of unknown function (DUF3352)
MCPADEERFCPAGVRPTIRRVTTTLSLSPRRLAVLAATAIAIPIAGCGSSDSSSSGNTDPAKAIPASAPFYLEATVRPDGKQRTDVEAALKKILRTDDPGAKIKELINKEASKDGGSYEKDIEPWLGDKAAVAITSLAGESQAVVVVNSTDDSKAEDSLAKEHDYSEKRSYEGTDYRYDPSDKSAATVTEGFAVIGDEAAVKQVIDVLDKGGDSLASNADLQDAREKVGGQPGFMFVEMQNLMRSAVGSAGSTLGPQELSTINNLFKRLRAIGVGIGADAQAIRMNLTSIGEGSGAGSGPGSSLPLDKAPGDSWLAFTQSDVGKSIQGVLDSLKDSSTSDQITQLETATGLNVKEDLLSWMGDAAFFVEGDSVPSIGGALVVQSTDPAKTRTAITKIKRLFGTFGGSKLGPAPAGASAGFSMDLGNGARKPLLVGLADSRFVIAYGAKAFHDATNPSSTLSSNSTFQGAQGLLGSSAKPSFFMDWPTVVRFITLAGAGDPRFQQAKPYLDAFTAIIGGGSGDRKAEVAIGLK